MTGPEGDLVLRDSTRELINQVKRLLEAGKSPKEIAFRMKGRISHEGIKKLMCRNRETRIAYINTYALRHPSRNAPPDRILKPLKAIVPKQ